MDRETRKANFKKLQLPTASKKRDTRSNKPSVNNPTISNYFQAPKKVSHHEEQCTLSTQPCSPPPEKTSPKKKSFKRTKLTSFVLNEGTDDLQEMQIKKTRESDCFEPAAQKVKKATNLTTAKTTRKLRTKKQPNIKSAFLCNERAFSEITAQHCMAENFSPDDIEMALAMSKSEAENNGNLCVLEQEEVADLHEHETVRNKLKQYGFRTASNEDYNSLATAFMPVASRSKKSKWANKFTALTLRNSDIQLKKINAKIEELFAQQYKIKPLSKSENTHVPFTLVSSNLNRIKAKPASEVLTKGNQQANELIDYYVTELFEARAVPADYLLKSWDAIQGRDLSPQNVSGKQKLRAQRLEKVYTDLEMDFGVRKQLETEFQNVDSVKILVNEEKENVNIEEHPEVKHHENLNEVLEEQQNEMRCSEEGCLGNQKINVNIEQHREKDEQNEELDELIKLLKKEENGVAKCDISIHHKLLPTAKVESPVREPPDKRAKKMLIGEINNPETPTKNTPTLSLKVTAIAARAKSPDIFADSEDENDDDDEMAAVKKLSLEVYKDDTIVEGPHCITTYEIYSSDETKNISFPEKHTTTKPASLSGVETTDGPNFIDLTQIEDFDEQPAKHNSMITNNFEFISSPAEHEKSKELSFTLSTQAHPEDKIDSILSDFADKSCFFHFEKDKQLTTSCHKQTTNAVSLLNRCRSSYQGTDCKQTAHVIEQPIFRKSLSFVELSSDRSIKPNCSEKFTRYASELPLKTHNKSSSFSENVPFNLSTPSIDLTQSESDEDSDDDECLMLSDDEINYSLFEANKNLNRAESMETSEEEDMVKKSFSPLSLRKSYAALFLEEKVVDSDDIPKPSAESSMLRKQNCWLNDDELDAYLASTQTQDQYDSASGNSRSPNKSALSRERAEFGILDAAISEPLLSTQADDKVPINWADASFLDSPSEKTSPMKRYSSSNKFQEFIKQINNKSKQQSPTKELVDDLDEFDKIVYGAMEAAIEKQQQPALPKGLDQLINGDINFEIPKSPNPSPSKSSTVKATPKKASTGKVSPVKRSPTKASTSKAILVNDLSVPETIEVNGNVYSVRICTEPKPNFSQLSEAELLKRLYNYGIKPLKRKQAIKMLEYIYNQTHPIMLAEGEELTKEFISQQILSKSISMPALTSATATVTRKSNLKLSDATTSSSSAANSSSNVASSCSSAGLSQQAAVNSYTFHDSSGEQLLRFTDELHAEMKDEFYILQTNITKKTPQPLVPLHIAWYNLVCANPELHESVLMYEPIDLQQIYLHFKSLGYRYDPKDLKVFFDQRCIIFRYDINPGKSAERHVRKPKKKSTKKRHFL